MIRAVLFDLDGTLLPMNTDDFTKGYMSELAKALCPAGVDARAIINSVWAGAKAMYKNDGSRANIELFWEDFEKFGGLKRADYEAKSDAFYDNEFHRAKAYTFENTLAAKAVELAGRGGRKVVLATNPLFPRNAQVSRLSWIALSETQFDLITSYENEYFTKPNPNYYLSICERIGVTPEECLMIGNDAIEDIMAASKIGMNCFFVTDYALNSDKFDWNGEAGSFEELIEFLKKI